MVKISKESATWIERYKHSNLLKSFLGTCEKHYSNISQAHFSMKNVQNGGASLDYFSKTS